jgi:putative ABC transport system substrate-binding protein
MNRRDVIAALGGAAAWPVAARGQQPAVPVIGFLNSGSATGYAPMAAAFRQALNEVGYTEGRNVAIEYRWADGQYDRLSPMARELVGRQVNVIVANSPGNLAVKLATTTIPLVFTTADDPVRVGLVVSLSRPGGNVTGATQMAVELMPKRVEVAHELSPAISDLAILVNPANSYTELILANVQAIVRSRKLKLHVLHASSERDFDGVFAALTQMRVGVLVISTDTFLVSQTRELAALTVRHAVPAIFQDRAFAHAGGLMSYGGSITDLYRIAGVYTGRILKGENPADLPVQQSTRVELILNLKTAKTLGLELPPTLLARADEVIE